MTKVSDYVEALNLSSGQTHRGKCPVCHRSNTFTVEHSMGKLVWNCYSASCSAKGAHEVGYSKSDIGRILDSMRTLLTAIGDDVPTFDIPPYLIPYANTGWAKDWLTKHKVVLTVKDRLVDYLRTDIRNNRLVFLCKDPTTGEVVDAVGRSNTDKPKWLRYGDSGLGFYYYHHHYLMPTAVVIVEDALSAVCISRAIKGVIGYALMGTSMSLMQRSFIADTGLPVIICLDRDAQSKALKMRKDMPLSVAATVYMPKDDLKYGHEEDTQAIQKLISNNC